MERLVPADEQAQFLQQLAEDLNTKNIKLPSFPDVVIKIRTALEDPTCTSERLADVVRTDAALVARLLMAANSAFHNRAGIEVVDLNLAISRLGFEVVRNTAITLAVEQIFNASQHEELRDAIKQVWDTSLSLASMCFVIARHSGSVNADNAYLCGLFHEVGKLYILSKAREFPALLGDDESLARLLDEWYATVGKSIVESWGFSADIANTMEAADNLGAGHGAGATLNDVVFAAQRMLADEDASLDDVTQPVAARLSITAENLPAVREAYDLHAQSMRQSVS